MNPFDYFKLRLGKESTGPLKMEAGAEATGKTIP